MASDDMRYGRKRLRSNSLYLYDNDFFNADGGCMQRTFLFVSICLPLIDYTTVKVLNIFVDYLTYILYLFLFSSYQNAIYYVQ